MKQEGPLSKSPKGEWEHRPEDGAIKGRSTTVAQSAMTRRAVAQEVTP